MIGFDGVTDIPDDPCPAVAERVDRRCPVCRITLASYDTPSCGDGCPADENAAIIEAIREEEA